MQLISASTAYTPVFTVSRMVARWPGGKLSRLAAERQVQLYVKSVSRYVRTNVRQTKTHTKGIFPVQSQIRYHWIDLLNRSHGVLIKK